MTHDAKRGSTLPGSVRPARGGASRRRTVLGALLGMLLLGMFLEWAPALYHKPQAPSVAATAVPTGRPVTKRAAHAQQKRETEIRARFEEAVVMLHARQYDHAATALHRVLELNPTMPEAHVNMGFALLGRGQAAQARDFFSGALDLNPRQVNAYYGLAVAFESLAQYPEALGAMRTFVHLSPEDDPHARKANAAIWEWQARLDFAEQTAPSPAVNTKEGEAPDED